MNNYQQPNAKIEFLSLGLNQLIMFCCVLFWGWKLTELLTLLGIELLVAGLLWYYVEWHWGLRLRPHRQRAELNKFGLRLFLQISALVLSSYLIFMSVNLEQSNLLTVEMCFFALFFALMPFGVLAIWQQRGYIPTIELLPAQLRILVAYPQLFATPLLCGIGFGCIQAGWASWQGAALICGLKLLFDLYLYRKSNV